MSTMDGVAPAADPPPGAGADTPSARRLGVDAVRAVALLAVIVLHAPKFGVLGSAIDQLARFAVPFFLLASGYFLERQRGSDGRILARGLWRIGLPFVVWALAYNLGRPTPLADFEDGFALLGGGSGFHLWFLPALLASWALLLLLRRAPRWAPPVVCLAFYAVALVSGPYAEALLGWTPKWNPDHSPLMALLFVAVGYALARRRTTISLGWALALAAAGAALSLGEGRLLHYSSLSHKDVFIGTAPFAVGLFLASLRLNHPALKPLAYVGGYGLGVYCLHLAVLRTLMAWFPVSAMPQAVLLWLATFALTFAAVWLLARVKVLRPVLV